MMYLERIVSFLCICYIIVSSTLIATNSYLPALAAVASTPTGTVLVQGYEDASDGADVYLDNTFAGKLAPPSGLVACPIGYACVQNELSFTSTTGSHTIRVSKQDYQDYTQSISVSENKVTEVGVTLISAIYGYVTVYSYIEGTDGASVTIRNSNVANNVGSMTLEQQTLWSNRLPRYSSQFNAAAGQYQLIVSKAGYQDFVKTIDVTVGKPTEVGIDTFYGAGMGRIDISSTNPNSEGAEVLIDGEPVGSMQNVPCQPYMVCLRSNGLVVDWEVGRYNLTVISDPTIYYAYSSIVDVKLAQTTIIRFSLVERNNTPIAMVRVEPSVAGGEQVILDGGDSYDLDSNILSYSWKQVLNAGDPKVTLRDANTAQAKFTAPKINEENGITLTFELTVSDGLLDGVSVPAQVKVQIMPSGTALPKLVDAGPDLSSNTDLPDKTGTILLFSPTDAEGARVFVDNQLKGSIKSENGLYLMEIKGLATGSHAIRVEKIGYETFTKACRTIHVCHDTSFWKFRHFHHWRTDSSARD
jgi:K319-like protein/PEGA domain-containing protein